MPTNLRNPTAQLNSLPVNERVGVLYTVGRNTSAVKTLTQTVNNSTVMVPDAELGIYLGTAPKTRYYFRLVANLAIAVAANNIKYGFIGPDGLVIDPTSRWFGEYKLTGVASQIDTPQNALNGSISGGATNAWTQLIVEGTIRPESPGYFGFQFAQQVAAANNTSVLFGSCLFALEMPN
jgi:hypothetical protein